MGRHSKSRTPQGSGSELAERARSIRADVKVLYMSGYAADAIVHHRFLSPGIALLQKPITPDSLLRKVRSPGSRPRGALSAIETIRDSYEEAISWLA